VAGDRRGVAQAAYQDPLGRRRGGDGPSAVGGHEDYVFTGDHPRRVLLGVRAQIVALYPLGTLLATSQEAARVESSTHLIGLLQTRDRVDAPGTILQNRQQGRRRQEHVHHDHARAGEPLRFDLLPRHQDP
jgi:hypothetical protein